MKSNLKALNVYEHCVGMACLIKVKGSIRDKRIWALEEDEKLIDASSYYIHKNVKYRSQLISKIMSYKTGISSLAEIDFSLADTLLPSGLDYFYKDVDVKSIGCMLGCRAGILQLDVTTTNLPTSFTIL
ncbi:hypothetical protein L1987_54198 [Smallanthus sonchifolius]|uniref:Uncharacterized protein n=1 Tax=Smallanthus sonchifolius TaxID=185202 RepID=A0ACB9E6X8_9ASTR|nr:hypothetical protein L1987_54198 [Smallanthus sonchifolius]